MAKINEIKQQAEAVKNATQVGENTAMRVGGALAGLADIAKQQDVELGKKANKADMDVELNKKFDKGNIAQELGSAENKVISQKAVSTAITYPYVITDYICRINYYESDFTITKDESTKMVTVKCEKEIGVANISTVLGTKLPYIEQSYKLNETFNYKENNVLAIINKTVVATSINKILTDKTPAIILMKFNSVGNILLNFIVKNSDKSVDVNGINKKLADKFDKGNIVQTTGNAEDKVMSQKAVSAKLSDLTKPLSVYRGKFLRYNDSNLQSYDKIYMSELLLILNKDVEINGNTIDKTLYGISFFDKDFNVITLSSLPDEVTNSFTFSPKSSYVPENARYFCVYVNTRGDITKKIIVSAEESIFTGILYPEIVDSRDRIKAATEAAIKAATENVLYKDVLYGKKWAPCGDSFTAGDFTGLTENILIESGKYKGKKKTYPYIIGSRLNMDIVDSSISGSIMALDKSYVDGTTTDINLRNPFSHTRYKNIPKDVDYITIMFGLNDMSHSNLGSIDDIDNNSFYGAFNVVLEYFITNMPHAKIGIIISCGWLDEAHRKAMLDISEKWGIPILDMKGDINIPMMNGGRIGLNVSNKAVELRNKNFCVSSSNPHPNPVAYEYMSTFVENFLRSL